MLKKSNETRGSRGEGGFTLIESLMAISILSIVAVQILNVQGSSISVTQSSRDNMRATWALRSAISQMEYALDALGPKGLPKDATYPWTLDQNFQVNVKVEDTPLPASKLLFTALKMGNAAGHAKEGGQEDSEDPTGGLKEIGTMLDSQIPKDMYRTAKFVVSWKEGDASKSLEGGMLIIDTSMLSGIGNLGNMGGGLLGGNGDGGTEDGDGNSSGGGNNSGGGSSSGGGNNAGGGSSPGGGNRPGGGSSPGGGNNAGGNGGGPGSVP